MTTNEAYPVSSVRTTFRIVEALAERGPSGVTELAREVELSKSSVHKHLTTLESLNYVVKEESTYRLGLRFLGVGNRVRERSELYHAAKPAIDNLAKTAGAVTNLMVVEHGFGVYAYRAGETFDSDDRLPVVGGQVHLHATAGGKAILSQLSDEEIERIIDLHGLPSSTEKTITEKRALQRELRSIQDRGLAFERGEHMPSVQCVAAPVTAPGHPVGAITVSGSIEQMSGKKLEEDLAGLVVSTSNAIEVALLQR
ncbi:IclR family transcriptional regulator [Haloprofundus salilacus]|uniref:IclR family transcriptional regulator n=1 Tax=Haloprofundus salilacus TaxID=2876190 RepID=UPI001CCEDD45|nr:IclR family transcriptional regulator [Haloprofundus salilacus]